MNFCAPSPTCARAPTNTARPSASVPRLGKPCTSFFRAPHLHQLHAPVGPGAGGGPHPGRGCSCEQWRACRQRVRQAAGVRWWGWSLHAARRSVPTRFWGREVNSEGDGHARNGLAILIAPPAVSPSPTAPLRLQAVETPWCYPPGQGGGRARPPWPNCAAPWFPARTPCRREALRDPCPHAARRQVSIVLLDELDGLLQGE